MTPGETHRLLRKNFIEKATLHFRFLCDDHGYADPQHSFHQQANGSVISDRLAYTHPSIDRLIVLYNAYHPVDYGFEVQFYRPSVSVDPSDRLRVYWVLKEDQDVDQTYLANAAKTVKEKYIEIIAGQRWDDSI